MLSKMESQTEGSLGSIAGAFADNFENIAIATPMLSKHHSLNAP